MKSFFKNLYKHPKPTTIQSVRLEGIYRLCSFIFRGHTFSTHLSLFWLRHYMWLELLPFSPLRNHSPYQEGLRERPPLSRGHGDGMSPQMSLRASGSPEDPSRLSQQRSRPQPRCFLQVPLGPYSESHLNCSARSQGPGQQPMGLTIPGTVPSPNLEL